MEKQKTELASQKLENHQKKKMFLLDDQIIDSRKMIIQDVIDLVQANGWEYLNQIKALNNKFSKNPNNKVLSEANFNEQTIPFRIN